MPTRSIINGTTMLNEGASNNSYVFGFPITDVYKIIYESNQESSYLGFSAQIALIAVYSTLIILGVLGNFLVAFVIGRKSELRTSRNLYIINLTISDVSMCLVCMPFTLVGLLRKNWTLGNYICKLVPFLQCTNILVSTATIVAIATDRYISIVWATRGYSSKSYVPRSVAVIWLVSLAFSMPLFVYYYEEKVLINGIFLFNRCVYSWSSVKVQVSWTITLLLIQYVISILVLSFVHVNINKFLKKNQTSQRDARKLQREMERNRRTTILLTSVALTFAVSWLPWHVINFLADLHYSGFRDTNYFYTLLGGCHAVAMSTACSNPILYGWLNTNLKKELSFAILHFFNQMTCSKRQRQEERRRATSSVKENLNSRMEINPKAINPSGLVSFTTENPVITSQLSKMDSPQIKYIITDSERSRSKLDCEMKFSQNNTTPILAENAFSSQENMADNLQPPFHSKGKNLWKSNEEIYTINREIKGSNPESRNERTFSDVISMKCENRIAVKIRDKTKSWSKISL